MSSQIPSALGFVNYSQLGTTDISLLDLAFREKPSNVSAPASLRKYGTGAGLQSNTVLKFYGKQVIDFLIVDRLRASEGLSLNLNSVRQILGGPPEQSLARIMNSKSSVCQTIMQYAKLSMQPTGPQVCPNILLAIIGAFYIQHGTAALSEIQTWLSSTVVDFDRISATPSGPSARPGSPMGSPQRPGTVGVAAPVAAAGAAGAAGAVAGAGAAGAVAGAAAASTTSPTPDAAGAEAGTPAVGQLVPTDSIPKLTVDIPLKSSKNYIEAYNTYKQKMAEAGWSMAYDKNSGYMVVVNPATKQQFRIGGYKMGNINLPMKDSAQQVGKILAFKGYINSTKGAPAP